MQRVGPIRQLTVADRLTIEGPTAASMTNYLTPVVAVLLGIAFVDERLTGNLIIGTAMILVGLWIADHSSDERETASDILKLSEGAA